MTSTSPLGPHRTAAVPAEALNGVGSDVPVVIHRQGHTVTVCDARELCDVLVPLVRTWVEVELVPGRIGIGVAGTTVFATGSSFAEATRAFVAAIRQPASDHDANLFGGHGTTVGASESRQRQWALTRLGLLADDGTLTRLVPGA